MALQTNLLSQIEKKAQLEAELQRYEEQADFLYRKQRLERIEYFADQYSFLANEYECLIYYEGLVYHSVYAAFQAARADDEETRVRISSTNSILEVFHIAQHIDDPKDWSKNRLRVMETLLRDKFRRHPELRDRLRDTNNYQLINTQTQASASNLFWGVYDGRLLQEIRQDLQNNEEIDKWLLMSFSFEKDRFLIPIIKLKVYKDNQIIETITLSEKSYFYFGQQKKNDVFLAHPSVSRSQSVLFVNSSFQVNLIDLGSRAGTFINDQQIEAHFPYPVMNEDRVKFAKSTRVYYLEIDYSDCKDYVQRKVRQTEHRVQLLEKVQSGKATQEELKASLGLVTEDIVMVQDLPERVSHFELKQLFSMKGRKISELKIPQDKCTGNTKNVAFIRYENEKDAQMVVENEKLNLRGQRLKLQLSSQEKLEKFLEELRWGSINRQEIIQEQKKEGKKEEKDQTDSDSSDSSDSKSRSRSRSHNRRYKNHKRQDKRQKKHNRHKHRY